MRHIHSNGEGFRRESEHDAPESAYPRNYQAARFDFEMSNFLIIFSPSRRLARWLIDNDYICGIKTMLIWNAIFYAIIVTFYVFSFANKFDDYFSSNAAIISMMLFCIARTNELVMAFYEDALPPGSKPKKGKKGLPITARDRIILLTLAYVEIIAQFGILYYLMQMYFSYSPFKEEFDSIVDAWYFSAITITTTGYGDYSPIGIPARLFVVYETSIGIVFIALGLAAYMSGRRGADKDEGSNK